jgi:hypothetical protein
MKKKSKIGSAIDPENPPLNREFFKRAKLGKMHVKPTRVDLDPDVARDFRTSKEVNEALRTFQEIKRVVQPAKRKKTA